ncbi:MAG: GAF domain-containing protein [Anaerolineales bacterium]
MVISKFLSRSVWSPQTPDLRGRAKLDLIKNLDQEGICNIKLAKNHKLLLEQIMVQLEPDAVILWLINKNTSQPVITNSLGLQVIPSINDHFHSWKGLIWRVIQKRDLVSLPNIWTETSALVRASHFRKERFITYHGLPLISRGKMLGVLEIFHRREFKAESIWIELFRNLAAQGSNTLDTNIP